MQKNKQTGQRIGHQPFPPFPGNPQDGVSCDQSAPCPLALYDDVRRTLSHGNMVPSVADKPSARLEAWGGSRLSGLDSQANISVSKPAGSNCNPPGSLLGAGGGMPEAMGSIPCLWAFAISLRRTRSRDRPGSSCQIGLKQRGKLALVKVCNQSV